MNGSDVPADAKCCPNCFEHEWLKDLVLGRSREQGDCHFCGARQVRLVPVQTLAKPFENLLSDYVHEAYKEHEKALDSEHHSGACLLIAAIQEDWSVFSVALINSAEASRLLGYVLLKVDRGHRGELRPDSWVLRFSKHAMRNEWAFIRRVFGFSASNSAIAFEDVKDNLKISQTIEQQVARHFSYYAVLLFQGIALFRARSGSEFEGDRPVPYVDMGPNPTHPPSRANVGGQYALYLSEKEDTAIREIRQPVDSAASVAQFATERDLTIVDLCLAMGRPNPFVFDNLSWILDLRYLLSELARLISKPVENGLEYFQTQHFANIARGAGYDGIRYPSALNWHDSNVVLFRRDSVVKRTSWVNSVAG